MNNLVLYGNRLFAKRIPVLELGDITTKGTPYDSNWGMVTGYNNYSIYGGINADRTGFAFDDSCMIINYLESGVKYYPSINSEDNPDSLGYINDDNSHQLHAYHDSTDYYFDMMSSWYDYGTHVDTRAWLAIATINGVSYGGFLCRRYYWNGSEYVDNGWIFAHQALNDPLQNVFVKAEVVAGQGNKGFRPIGYIPQRNAFGGGYINGETPGYTTDELELPGAPDETHGSAIMAGMINIYQITDANLNALGKALFGSEGLDGLLVKLQNSFLNPLDAIISLQVFPCTPDLGSSEHIKLFDWSCYVNKLGTDTTGNKLAKQFKTYNFGKLNVSEMWNSYLDYDSTSFELYLPFIGSVDIPIAEVMNGSIEVEYTVDFLTGMCVANVLCTKNVPLSSNVSENQYAEHSYMGNCSVHIPLNNVTYGNIIGSLMQAASAGLKTGNAGVALASLVESGLSGGLQPTVKTKGTVNANAGFCSVLYPYISITRPITAESESFQEVEGYPSYMEGTLGSYEDLCICDDIDLSGMVNATDSEMEEIRSICKSGIYI